MTRDSFTKLFGLVTLLIAGLGLWWWMDRAEPTGPETADAGAQHGDAPADGASGLRPTGSSNRGLDLRRAPRAAVTGTVRDEAGEPIAKAQVCAVLRDVELAQTDRHAPYCTTTRNDGTFRIDELFGASHQLYASAEGYLPEVYEARRGIQKSRSSRIELEAGQTRQSVDFVLKEGGVAVEGVIKDIAGGTVEGAWVSSGGRWGRGGSTFGRSDDEGRFRLWVDPPSTTVTAYAEGYAKGTRSAAVPDTFVEVYLTPESVVVGTVVWAGTNDPVEGARISTRGRRRGGSGPVLSNADGSFRIEGLEPGAYKVDVKGEEYTGMAAQKVHVGLGETSDPLVVEVHAAFSVRGQVLTDDETPCSYGTVTLQNKDRKGDPGVRSEGREGGDVLVEGVLPGTYEVTVRCRDYVPQEEYPDIVVADASLDGLQWTVRTGQVIRGTVLDSKGTPLEGARVSARAKSSKDPRAQRVNARGSRTEPDGAFELRGLLPGSYELWARHDDHPGPDDPSVVELPEGADLDGVELRLAANGQILGIVRDENGTAVAGASVSLSGARWGGMARTNDLGGFVMEHIQVGDYRIAARRGWSETMRAPGATDDDEAGERIEVRDGEETSVELVVESQNGRITGRVLGEGGEPIPDAFVEAVRESDSAAASKERAGQRARWGSWLRQPVLTDDDGRFEIGDLSEGATYSIYANRKGGGEAVAEHVAEGTDVEVSIGEVGVLAGIVRVEGGTVPERFSIRARDKTAGAGDKDRFFRTEGQWELSNLPPGTYEVTVDASEGNAKTTVELPAGGEKTDIELMLSPRIELKGILVDATTREPIPGLKVVASAEGGNMRFGTNMGKAGAEDVSGTDGAFTVEDAPTGKVRLMVTAPGFADNDYAWTWITRRIAAEPAVQDLGTLELVARRVKRGEESGDLGFKTKELAPDTEPEDSRKLVAVVRPGGPAAKAGLQLGDEIISVDGQAIGGLEAYRWRRLTQVPPGTALSLKVTRDEESVEVRLTAGPPI